MCWTAIRDVPSSIALLKNLKHLYICRWKSFESYSLPTSLELLGLVFPSLISAILVNPIISAHQLLLLSLSSLQSLTYLHLSDLNLLSIPNDIDCIVCKSSSFFFLLKFTSLDVLFILGRESNEMKLWVLNYFSMITNLICPRYIIEIFSFCISLTRILKNKTKSLYCASCTLALPFGFHIAKFFLFIFFF